MEYMNNPFMETPGLQNQPRDTISNSNVCFDPNTISNQFELDIYMGLLKP